MKTHLLIFFVCISFLSCELFSSCDLNPDDKTIEEPVYTTKIAWDSGILSNEYWSHKVNDDSVFFYGRPPEETSAAAYNLTRLDANTGEVIWRSKKIFYGILFCQPIVTNDYIYVCLDPATILCFDYETGKLTATVKVSFFDDPDSRLIRNPIEYQEFLYLSFWSRSSGNGYFTRLNATKIIHNTDSAEIPQVLSPELIWEPIHFAIPYTKPIIHDNIIYVATETGGYTTVELAGFDINTKERVFYQTFGGQGDGDVPFPEKGGTNSNILIHNNVLYYLSWSIAAWNLKTGEQLYRHVFTWDTPNENMYDAVGMQEAVFYNNKIYYTNGLFESSDGYRNIHCIDAKTGKLVWNDVRSPYALNSNAIIAHDKLYVTQSTGLLVYEPETGKLLGIDKSFVGTDLGRNILYNDYIICIIKDPEDLHKGRMAAIYVGE